MHILIVLIAGIVQLAVFLMFGWHWGVGMALAAKVFIPVWLLVAALNMWVGVAHAGYGVKDELPILLLNFAVPAVIAALAAWRLAPSV